MKHYDEKQMQENILYLEALSEQYPCLLYTSPSPRD